MKGAKIAMYHDEFDDYEGYDEHEENYYEKYIPDDSDYDENPKVDTSNYEYDHYEPEEDIPYEDQWNDDFDCSQADVDEWLDSDHD